MKVSIDVKGNLPDPDFKRAVRTALLEAGDKAAGYAKSMVPVKTGKLQSSIKPLMIDDTKVSIAPKSAIAHLIEFGTKRHLIYSKKGKMLKIGSKFARYAVHPGSKKQPFLGPAIKNHEPEYGKIITDNIELELKKTNRSI